MITVMDTEMNASGRTYPHDVLLEFVRTVKAGDAVLILDSFEKMGDEGELEHVVARVSDAQILNNQLQIEPTWIRDYPHTGLFFALGCAATLKDGVVSKPHRFVIALTDKPVYACAEALK